MLSSPIKLPTVQKLITGLFFLLFCAAFSVAQPSPTYEEAIAAYTELAKRHPKSTRLVEVGTTDSGLSLHLFIIDSRGYFEAERSHAQGDIICMVINGIHAGEPCGIEASMQFAEERAAEPEEGIVYVILPVYNIGGALQRNGLTRVNQNGPDAYGFRGNAQNLDLNRDFTKADAANTLSLQRAFHEWKPQVFVDTHTSNGADYPLAISLIHTMPEGLPRMQGMLLQREIVPNIYQAMAERGEEMNPYVYTKGATPEQGIYAFTDIARYSTGYAALWGALGFITEAHMLKPYEKRVEATRRFLESLEEVMLKHRSTIHSLYASAENSRRSQREFTTQWEHSDEVDSINFIGYRVDSLLSKVTGLPRLYYNSTQPYRDKVPYYGTHLSVRKFKLPKAFALPQGWSHLIEKLEASGVQYRRLGQDSLVNAEAYFVEDYKTVDKPYEGHYLHFETRTVLRPVSVQLREGDYIIPCNQSANAFLAQVFDPEGPDSYFNWNFFDQVLMQKEYFSAYLFEETAAELIKRNPLLRKSFEDKKSSDPAFAKDANAQLNFIYQNSKYREPNYLRIPVYRLGL